MNKYRKIKTLSKECLRGKSLCRTLHNIYLSSLPPFKGKGIDFGAKNASSSYYRFIDVSCAEMTYTDFYSQSSNKIKSIDFEKAFDLSECKYDFALCMNTLEHVYNHQKFLKNICNSLNDGGHLEGVVPFLHYFHADPNDYFRYTHTALQRLLKEAGFDEIEIKKIGCGGFTVSAGMISRILKFKPLVLISWFVCIFLDKALNKFWRVNSDIYGALVFSATKRPLSAEAAPHANHL